MLMVNTKLIPMIAAIAGAVVILTSLGLLAENSALETEIDYLETQFDNIEEYQVNGLLVLYNNMLQSLFSSQIKSFGIILLSIFVMFIILFQSFKLSFNAILRVSFLLIFPKGNLKKSNCSCVVVKRK